MPKGGLPQDANKAEAILLLGDSVGFDAVEEAESLACSGRARRI